MSKEQKNLAELLVDSFLGSIELLKQESVTLDEVDRLLAGQLHERMLLFKLRVQLLAESQPTQPHPA